jgi:phenylacetate-coenzyme A ligase PaaK-like adenylate-forming protein
VDEHGAPVRPGEVSAKVYVTNLFNHVQPLIRYELTDRVQVLDEPCPCGAQLRRIADIEGRLEEAFRYGEVVVSPYVFRIALMRDPAVREYQVLQTREGAHILLRAAEGLELKRLLEDVRRDLERVGVPDPQITAARVERFERGAAGKVPRMVPLRS